MTEPMSAERRAIIEAYYAQTLETGQFLADIYLREALAEVDRLSTELEMAFSASMYFDIQKVLDGALGTQKTDGAGQGIVEDVALLAAKANRLRAAAPAWADLKAVLAEHRDSDLTDNELTNKVMALWGGEDRG